MKLGALSPNTFPEEGSTTTVEPEAAQRDGEKSSPLCAASDRNARLGALREDGGEFQLLPLLPLQLGKKGIAGAGE